jgi:PAS domain S-box-containing protein
MRTTGWADLSLGRKGVVVIALPLVALVVSTLAFLWVDQEEDRIRADVDHTLEVRDEIQQVSQSLTNAETWARGFLLTQDETFLEPYRNALIQLPAELARLGSLVENLPDQSARVERIDTLSTEQLALIGELTTGPGGPPTGEERSELLRTSKELQDELRGELGAMRDQQNRLLAIRSRDVERIQNVALIVIAGGGVMGLLGGLAAMAMFTSGVVKRVQQLEENARRIDEGEKLLRASQADDEIGRLSRQIEATGMLLEARQSELHQARQFLEQLIERSPVIIFRRDPADLRTTFVSSNLERILGFKPEEVTRDQDLWVERIHTEDVDRVLAQTKEALDTGATSIARPRFRFRHKNGDWVWLESVIRIEYENGKPRDMLGYALDVSNRHKIEQELAERENALSTILDTSPDVIVITDELGSRRYVSPSITDTLGYSEDEALEGGPDAVHPEDRRLAIEQLRRAASGEIAVRARYRMQHKEGHWVWLDVRAQRLESSEDDSSERTEIILYAREISAQVELESELRRAKEDAESSSRAKSEFLSRMSHELRTPLNAILGFAQILEMEDLDAISKDSVEEILKGGRHLLDLINEVLDIARIETGRLGLSLEPVQLREVVEESIGLVRPLAAQRDVVLRGPTDIRANWHVMADRQRIKQVLLNLLSNAVKYNRPGGHVELSCRPTERGHMHLRVADTGLGIRPERMDLLFSPFERLGAEHTGVEGTGLGLALSKVLIEAMGGAIEVDSSPERGSKFTVSLLQVEGPVESAMVDVESGHVDPGSRPPRTLLYIEDNLSNLKLVEHILARRPEVKLHAAMHGRLGLELIKEHHPDLVLLDLNLPDISGAEVLSILREGVSTRDIPVVIISADATRHQIDRLMEAGARAYMTKPLDVQRFLEIVDESIESFDVSSRGNR